MRTPAVFVWSVLLGCLLAGCATNRAAKQPAAASQPAVHQAGPQAAEEPARIGASRAPAIPDLPRREGPINGRYMEWHPQWGEHNVYLRRVIHLVQIQWERVLAGEPVSPPPGTSVTVRFVMNADGRIARILDVEGNGPDEAIDACLRGLVNRAPYLAWTPAMKAALGEEQELAFTFQYQ